MPNIDTPAPDHDTLFRVEAQLHEMARDMGMTFDELIGVILHVKAFREWSALQNASAS